MTTASLVNLIPATFLFALFLADAWLDRGPRRGRRLFWACAGWGLFLVGCAWQVASGRSAAGNWAMALFSSAGVAAYTYSVTLKRRGNGDGQLSRTDPAGLDRI